MTVYTHVVLKENVGIDFYDGLKITCFLCSKYKRRDNLH